MTPSSCFPSVNRMPKHRQLPLAVLSLVTAAALSLGALTSPAGAAVNTTTATPPYKQACTYVKLPTIARILRATTTEKAYLLDKTPFHVIGCTYTAKKAKPARFFTIAYYPAAGIASVHQTAATYLAAIKTRAGKAASVVNGLGQSALSIQGGIDVIVATKKGWIVALDGYGPSANLKAEKAMLAVAIKPFN